MTKPLQDKGKKKASEIFEGEDSSLKRAFDSTMPQPLNREEWEKKLEFIWNKNGLHLGYKNNQIGIMKHFISSLLKARDEEVRGKVLKSRCIAFCPDCLTYGAPFGIEDKICGNCSGGNLRHYIEVLDLLSKLDMR